MDNLKLVLHSLVSTKSKSEKRKKRIEKKLPKLYSITNNHAGTKKIHFSIHLIKFHESFYLMNIKKHRNKFHLGESPRSQSTTYTESICRILRRPTKGFRRKRSP